MINSSLKEYFIYLGSLTGDAKPTCFDVPGPDILRNLMLVSYNDLPSPGYLTGFTYGLSDLDKPGWIHSRPELFISVKSQDISWLLAVGEVIIRSYERSDFEIGTIYNFGKPVSDDSRMSSFLIFTPSMLSREDTSVELPDRRVCLSQIYPIYEEEGDLIMQVGAMQFFERLTYDFSDVRRPRIQIL